MYTYVDICIRICIHICIPIHMPVFVGMFTYVCVVICMCTAVDALFQKVQHSVELGGYPWGERPRRFRGFQHAFDFGLKALSDPELNPEKTQRLC